MPCQKEDKSSIVIVKRKLYKKNRDKKTKIKNCKKASGKNNTYSRKISERKKNKKDKFGNKKTRKEKKPTKLKKI